MRMSRKVTGSEKKPPPNAVAKIRRLAAAGATLKTIALAVGTSDHLLTKWRELYPEINAAIVEGREKSRTALHNSLQQRAMDPKNQGGTTAAIFLLKSMHGYRENEPLGDGDRVSVIFNLPAPMTAEQYADVAKKLTRPRD
jgi:hypothetical protein